MVQCPRVARMVNSADLETHEYVSHQDPELSPLDNGTRSIVYPQGGHDARACQRSHPLSNRFEEFPPAGCCRFQIEIHGSASLDGSCRATIQRMSQNPMSELQFDDERSRTWRVAQSRLNGAATVAYAQEAKYEATGLAATVASTERAKTAGD
jgi:hypothetical protein